MLDRTPLRKYFAAYEEEMARVISVDGENLTFRQVLRRQAENLARSLVEGEPYRSFRWPA